MTNVNRRLFLGHALALGLRAGTTKSAGPAAAHVHEELVSGNVRFYSGQARHPHASTRWRRQAAVEGQHPQAVILCCSDSRVVPEILFDQGLGDLFTVRVAGNVLREDEVGSIEYAIEHFRVPLCVVLGHSSCGAVSAVVAGEHLLPEIEHLVSPIQAIAGKVRAEHPEFTAGQVQEVAGREHVRQTAARLRAIPGLVSEAVAAGRFQVEGGYHHLGTGRVEWLSPVR